MFRATPEALQRRRLAARGLSTEARKMPREYLASVPKSRNFVVAGVLIGFAGGVYMYTVQRIQTNSELGEEFDQQIFAKPEEEATPA